MSLIRRFGATLFSLLLLQLTLLGSGTLCAMHQAATSDRASASHASHSAGPAVVAASDQTVPRHSAPAGCAGSTPDQDAGCELPWAPGVCTSMTSCAITAAPSATLLAPGLVLHAAGNLPQPPSIHSGPVAAPELPPPRV